MKVIGPTQFCLLSKLAFLVLLTLPGSTFGQDASVRRATANTSDGLTFDVWVNRSTVRYGQDIMIQFKVENHSNKRIYLVRDKTSDIVIERDNILFPRPFVPTGGHEGYDYSFAMVDRGGSYRGRLTISKNRYKEVQPWRISVGFGYVTEIRGLNRQLRPGEDPLPLKSLLSSRLETLLICNLKVEVVDD
jgi:hypothetical protein